METNHIVLTPYGSHTHTGAIARTIKLGTLRNAVRMAEAALADHLRTGRVPPRGMERRVATARKRIQFLIDLRAELVETGPALGDEAKQLRVTRLRKSVEHEALAILGMAANCDPGQRAAILRFAAIDGVKFYS